MKILLLIKTVLKRLSKGSDKSRWSSVSNLHKEWDERTNLLASRIKPGSKVIEFGAGRCALKGMLPPGCSYTPSDIVSRGGGTVVCDLNRGFPANMDNYDAAVFSGVLEYVHDIERVVKWLHNYAELLMVSYSTLEKNSRIVERRKSGWVTDFSDKSFVSMFERNGYSCSWCSCWKKQNLYVFKRIHVGNDSIETSSDG